MKKKFLLITICIIVITLILVVVNRIGQNSQETILITNEEKSYFKSKNVVRSKNHLQMTEGKERAFVLQSLIVNKKDTVVIINGRFFGGIVNPISLRKNIRINKLGLSKLDEIQYNKKGSMFRIFLSMDTSKKILEDSVINIEFRNVKSMKGNNLLNEDLRNIEINQLYICKEDGVWYKY